MFWYVDWTYFVMVLPAVIFALWASARVSRVFRHYQKQYSHRGLTAAETTRRILDAHGLTDIPVERVPGRLTDHYDPRARVIRLSSAVYDSTSTAAIGVAAHEAGHAIQYAEDYAPIKVRMAIVPVAGFGSWLAVPLVLLGLFLSVNNAALIWLAYAGVACFALSAIFQIVTLPTEYNASSRAISILEHAHILEDDELLGAKKVLSAAALTYVAALAVSLTQLLRLLLLVGGGRRD